MKKADKVKLEREIAAKVSEVAKLLRKRAAASECGNHSIFQADFLPGGAVVIQGQALSPENTAKLLGEH
ncbi:MAG: hypothetical protein II823_06765 [Kiritimatiellae bacterium]|nr:hypothetical protein [Kiritimatiellia bacterium]